MTGIEFFKQNKEPISVIISDIAMPDHDGYDFIKMIRNLNTANKIPAIALSTYAALSDREKALKSGFDLHISKPVRQEVIVEAILDILS